jgi:hypothetical protein
MADIATVCFRSFVRLSRKMPLLGQVETVSWVVSLLGKRGQGERARRRKLGNSIRWLLDPTLRVMEASICLYSSENG